MESKQFIIEYVSTDADNAEKTMEPTVVDYGVPTPLRRNIYKRKGYKFIGWKAFRTSDGKVYYDDKNNKRKCFIENKQPEDYKLHLYPDMVKVAKMTDVDNNRIIMYPQWEKIKTSDESKKILEERIKSRPVVLLGSYDRCKSFYEKYSQTLNIRCILLDDAKAAVQELNGVAVQPFTPKKLVRNDYVIICQPVKSSKLKNNDVYRKAKETVIRAGLSMMQDFIRADIAELVLDRKKLWILLGYCQLDTLHRRLFTKLECMNNDWVFLHFRYDLDTLPTSYKYDECKELLKLCDCLVYVPLFAAKDKIAFELEEYLAPNSIQVKIPRIPFEGYYPYRKPGDDKKHWIKFNNIAHFPFYYSVDIIDELILKGLSDDEIYKELMREDLYSEEEIKRRLKYSFKFIEISEKACDIKILDYIKENLPKRMLYRDGFHYENCLYFELARRITKFLDLNYEDEINDMETEFESSGTRFLDYTEYMILPCVAKALNLNFITDETLYRVRFTQNGTIGTKATMKLMNRKEWIYTYIKYVKSVMTLKEFWQM